MNPQGAVISGRGDLSGPKVAPATTESPSKTQIEPPNTPWRPQAAPKASREAPESIPSRPESVQNHWFSLDFGQVSKNIVFSEAAVA